MLVSGIATQKCLLLSAAAVWLCELPSTDPPASRTLASACQAPSPAPQSCEGGGGGPNQRNPQGARSCSSGDRLRKTIAAPLIAPSRNRPGEQDQWEDLTDALRQAVFDPKSVAFADATAGTDALLRQVQETHEMGLPPDDDIVRNLRLLDRTLTGVLEALCQDPVDLHAACTRAEIFGAWLLQLLADLGK